VVYIKRLTLSNFRNYNTARLDNLQSGAVIFIGQNGIGKTNILEAVSLLSPGRGLRGASVSDFVNRKRMGKPWGVSAEFFDGDVFTKIGTGTTQEQLEKRQVRINGEMQKGQNALSDYVSCVWLTPQMDRLFLDSASHRRRFLDRFIYAFDPAHTGRLTRYEKTLRQRSKILKDSDSPDAHWCAALESQMAESAVAIAAARIDFCARLQDACIRAQELDGAHFPLAELTLDGEIERRLMGQSAVEVETWFKGELVRLRPRDALVGGAAIGVHRSDLVVRLAAKDMPADQCSTGEQKALLIGLILAHARLINAERGAPPLILLDEIAAHLDDGRRAALYSRLAALGGQVWLSGTDHGLFERYEGAAMRFEIEGDGVFKPIS
jgi:DNA replication and repair protein RecF|tara:strand:- start:177726 stop:178865 length:1140 start_codon:yes stop_codon:yes gene_type:complete